MRNIEALSFEERAELIYKKELTDKEHLNYALVELENCLSENGIEDVFSRYPQFQENNIFITKAHNCLKNLKTIKP